MELKYMVQFSFLFMATLADWASFVFTMTERGIYSLTEDDESISVPVTLPPCVGVIKGKF